MPTPAEIFRQTIEHFTTEFLHNPYLCYTEHGLHARFYAQLYDALAPEQRYLTWQGQRQLGISPCCRTRPTTANPRVFTPMIISSWPR